MIPTASDALLLAEEAHRGQVDKAGKPYIEHPIAVANILIEQKAGHSAILAGLLHDVVEDSDITLDDVRRLGYPEEVVQAVDSVTKCPGEAYMDMVRRAAADPIGRRVKLADNQTNSDPARLALLSEDEQAWFTQKYARARAAPGGEPSPGAPGGGDHVRPVDGRRRPEHGGDPVTGPQRFVGDLIARGWTVAGDGRGFVRLNWPGLADRPALFVPTDPSAPEFPNLWQAVLAELEDAVATGVQAAYVLAGLVAPTT